MTETHYDVDELPLLAEAVPLGIQHVLAMFASNVTMPIIVATAIGASAGDTAFLIQVAVFVSGIANVPDTVRILLETGIVPALFVAMVLNVVLPYRNARHG